MDYLNGADRGHFPPDIKTAEDARRHIEDGGVAWVERRIEESFALRLRYMKEKIVRLQSLDGVDLLLSNVLCDSILVDCRALFLEGGREVKQKNSTLQNVYRSRRMDDKAEEIDEVFEKTISDISLKEIIKGWVDKRIAHMDFLRKPAEDELFERTREFIFSEGDSGMMPVLRAIVDEYEAFVKGHGASVREQIELAFKLMTGNPNSEEG